MRHLFTLFIVIIAANACGNSNNSLSDGKSLPADLPTFTLACTMIVSDTAIKNQGIRSARVTYSGGHASLRIDQNDIDKRFTADNAVDVSAADDYLVASWTSGSENASFAASSVDGTIFEGELNVSGATLPVKCTKVVTDDRDDDEFSLVCTQLNTATTDVDHQTLLRDVILTYEERELEMFINPTGDRQIFDLERASEVKVSNLEINGEWGSEHTKFKATSLDGDRYDGRLLHNGVSTPLVCWKL